jgi:ribonucleoside-diphosphate reductase beta chain
MERITAPEVQIYYARQIYEESLHTWAYQHCIETLGLDQGHIYNLYRTIPEINRKIQMSQARTDALANGTDNIRLLVLALIFYHTMFEGGWFYNGFTPIFALQRRGLMQGTGEQFQYILRDESMHAAFGIKVINSIFHEIGHCVEPQEIYDMVHEVVDAEEGYAKVAIPTILGYSPQVHVEQLKFILNRRMRQLGLDEQFPGAKCTVPWLDEQINIKKEKNFFETRVTEYQVGTQLDWTENGDEEVTSWTLK